MPSLSCLRGGARTPGSPHGHDPEPRWLWSNLPKRLRRSQLQRHVCVSACHAPACLPCKRRRGRSTRCWICLWTGHLRVYRLASGTSPSVSLAMKPFILRSVAPVVSTPVSQSQKAKKRPAPRSCPLSTDPVAKEIRARCHGPPSCRAGRTVHLLRQCYPNCGCRVILCRVRSQLSPSDCRTCRRAGEADWLQYLAAKNKAIGKTMYLHLPLSETSERLSLVRTVFCHGRTCRGTPAESRAGGRL